MIYTSRVDVNETGLSTDARLLNVRYSDYSGGRRLGQELCRLTSGIDKRQHIVCIIQGEGGGAGEALSSRRLCDGFVSKVQDYCPTKQHIYDGNITFPPGASEQDITDLIGAAVTMNSDASVIVCPSDSVAEVAVSALGTYKENGMRNMFVSGFDHNSLGQRLLDEEHIFGTIDIQYYDPGRGLMFTVSRVIDLVGRSRDRLPEGLESPMYSTTQLYVTDMASKTLCAHLAAIACVASSARRVRDALPEGSSLYCSHRQDLLAAYDKDVKPLGDVEVYVNMKKVTRAHTHACTSTHTHAYAYTLASAVMYCVRSSERRC
ncbi:hypothetical protein OAO87_04670 [bacterium]|nr:hypothetical protein [bacterium]